MKKGLFTKGLALLLCLLMLVPMIASCNKDEAETPETSGNDVPQTTTPPADEEEFDINDILNSSDYKMVVTEGATDYVIVYPAGAEIEKAVAESLKAKLEENTGAVIEVKDDSAAEAEKEILIGNTNRTADDTIFNGVKAKDYVVKASGSKLLIAAYDVECYELAWKRAVIALNVTEAGGKYYAYFKTDYSYQRNGEYTAADLTVNGNSISKYVVVYGDDLEKAIAESVQLMIQETCGYILPVKKSTVASEATEFEIIVGDATGRTAAQLETENTYEFKAIGKLLVFYFTNDRSGKKAVMDYEDKIEELIAGGSTEIKDLLVSGKMSNAGAGDVITSMNFNGMAASTDTAAVLETTGIDMLYENTWSTPSKYAEITSGGKLKLNGGGTAYEIVSEDKLIGLDAFTLQFDLEVASLGVMEVLFAKSHTAYSTIESNSVMFRNFPSDNVNFDKWTSGTTTLGYLAQYINAGTKKNMGTAPTAIGGSAAYGATYKVVIEMVIGESISISIYDTNNAQVGTTTVMTTEKGTMVDSVTGISIRLQSAPITVDNIIFSNGSYADYQAA